MTDIDGWSVTVSRYGDPIVTIEERMLSGKADLTEGDLELIRHCAQHLMSFAHPAEPFIIDEEIADG